MANIVFVRCDVREPDWVKRLTFGGTALPPELLPTGDFEVWTDNGDVISIERKTPDDFLGSLRDERLFPQLARLAEARIADHVNGRPVSHWPYLMISGDLTCSNAGHVITERGETGWGWSAVQGALLIIQEMGVFVTYCHGDADLEPAIIRLAQRERGELKLLPPRPAMNLGAQAGFLCSLPGIGVETYPEVMKWAGGNLAIALVGLTDDEIEGPVSIAKRRRIIGFLGGKLMTTKVLDEKGSENVLR